MKPTFILALLYLCLSLLVISCETTETEPDYVFAEVVGSDFDEGWCVLKVEKSEEEQVNNACTAAPTQESFVTTRNLPEEYQVPGMRIRVALDQETTEHPTHLVANAMFPAVQVKHVSSASSGS